MEITLIRFAYRSDYTIGKMYVNDAYFCDTLEDTNRDLNKNGRFDNGETKVYGRTCIPFGHYTVDLTMSAHFKRVFLSLLEFLILLGFVFIVAMSLLIPWGVF